jgi:hypothetical protein|tara:strand:+ start:795 stop:965 length:171 start_codon:yes stop_codon:yes gene_type:complete
MVFFSYYLTYVCKIDNNVTSKITNIFGIKIIIEAIESGCPIKKNLLTKNIKSRLAL